MMNQSSDVSSSSVNPVRGALLLNLGTPDRPESLEVRNYLEEFLMDPYVIDIPYVFRWLLVHGFILQTRPEKSAAAYRKIWTKRGSPLLFHLLDLAEKVQTRLGQNWIVKPVMRYRKPSIESALAEFRDKKISELTVFPLYPQYSLAATESSIQHVQKIARKLGIRFPIKTIGPFYNHELFIGSFAQVAKENLENYSYDHLLFSFHGLPERQIKKTDPTGNHCLSSSSCCDQGISKNPNCYRAQCFVTAKMIASQLGIDSGRYTVCFQSRLGRTPWIKPFTDEFYRQMPQKGIRRLAVMCPAFVSDCLETLEEVQIRGKEDFIRNGGEDLKLVPSLNSTDIWTNAVAEILKSGRTD